MVFIDPSTIACARIGMQPAIASQNKYINFRRTTRLDLDKIQKLIEEDTSNANAGINLNRLL